MSKRVFLFQVFGSLDGEEGVAGGLGGGDDIGAADDDATPETADLESAHPSLELVHAEDERQRPWPLEAHERLYRALMSSPRPRGPRKAYTMRNRRKRPLEN